MCLVIGLAQIDIDDQDLHAGSPNEIPAGAKRTAGVPAKLIDKVLFRRLIHLESHRASGNNGGNSVFVHHLRRSEEHTSELQSLMRISYAVFCLKKKKKKNKS